MASAPIEVAHGRYSTTAWSGELFRGGAPRCHDLAAGPAASRAAFPARCRQRRGCRADRVGDQRRPRPLSRSGRGDGGAGRGDRGRRAPEQVWLARAPAALHGRHQRPRRRPARARPLPGLPHRPRRRIHLSRPRPAGRLCHARPDRRRAGPPALRRGAGGLDHRDPRPLQRDRRAARGPHRRLGAAAGQAASARRVARRRTRSPRSASACGAG